MSSVQTPEQKTNISGKLILGAIKNKPPIKEDDIQDMKIDQLDGNVTLDSSIISNSNCSSCESESISISETDQTQVSVQTWKKSGPQQIPVISNMCFENIEDPPTWYEYHTPRTTDEKQSKIIELQSERITE